MKKFLPASALLVIFFFLSVTPALALCRECGGYIVVDDEEGEVKATVYLKASVPNREGDYELSLESRPRREVLPGGEIVYTIFYGCSGALETERMTLSVEWLLPEGEVARFVSGSATTAYGGALPGVNESANSIVWEVSNFPGSTTSKKVSFKLQAKEEFGEAGKFPIEVRARLAVPGIVKEVSKRVTVTYPEKKVIEEIFPRVPATVYRYMRELFSHPIFQAFLYRFLLLYALFLFLYTSTTAVLYFDLSLRFLPLLIPFLLRRFLVLIGVFEPPAVWGRAFSASEGFPLPFVRVCVFDFSGRKLGSTFTNRSGGFGFSLPEDYYLVEVRKPGFVLESVRREGIFLSETRFLYEFDPDEGERAVLLLRRKKALSGFLEKFLEGFALEFADFLVFFGLGLSLVNAILMRSFGSILLSLFFLIYLLFWTFLVFR